MDKIIVTLNGIDKDYYILVLEEKQSDGHKYTTNVTIGTFETINDLMWNIVKRKFYEPKDELVIYAEYESRFFLQKVGFVGFL